MTNDLITIVASAKLSGNEETVEDYLYRLNYMGIDKFGIDIGIMTNSGDFLEYTIEYPYENIKDIRVNGETNHPQVAYYKQMLTNIIRPNKHVKDGNTWAEKIGKPLFATPISHKENN